MVRLRTSPLMRALVFGVAYLGAAELGHTLGNPDQRPVFAAFGAAAGVYLATVVLTMDRTIWPYLALAAGSASLTSDVLLHGQPLAASLGFAVARCLEACLGGWLMRRFCLVPMTLTRMNDVFGVAVWGAGVSPMLGATLGAGVAAAMLPVGYGTAWLGWWMSHALGVLVIAPLIWTWDTQSSLLLEPAQRRGLAERVILLLGMFIVASALYGEFLPAQVSVPVYLLPFLLLAAVRFDPATTATALLIVAMVGLWNTSQGRGPFATMSASQSERALRGMGALAMISISVLLLAAVVAERKEADRKRRNLIDRLNQALAEIKTLRGLVPICAWCKKIRDSKDYWHSVEDYIVKNTEARLSHGMCPDCLARAKEELDRS